MTVSNNIERLSVTIIIITIIILMIIIIIIIKKIPKNVHPYTAIYLLSNAHKIGQIYQGFLFVILPNALKT